MSNNSEELNPAVRAEKDISSAINEVSDTQDVVVVDEKLEKVKKDYVVQKQKQKLAEASVKEASEERVAAPVLEHRSTRNRARLLFITTDRLVYEEHSEARNHLLELEQMFAEVHVLMLEQKSVRRKETERISESVWVYPVQYRFWWKAAFDARRVASRVLSFGKGFRPDIIISDSPFESGWAGLLIANKYERPFQVHIKEDFLDMSFKIRQKNNKWRILIADHILKHTSCVRTNTAYMQKRIMERYKLTETQVEVLPVFYDIDTWQKTPVVDDLHKKFPEFKFVLLHVSTMNEFSFTGAVIDGLFYILRQYPTIGLVIVGDGDDRKKLEDRVQGYGLSKQIKFESGSVDILSYIKTAQTVIHTSEETSQDKIILQAAVAKVPIVCGNYGLASELFVDEESVLLCPVDSPPCFGEKVNRLLNDNPLRQKLAMNAREEVLGRIEQNYEAYMDSYRSSIERCLALGDGGEDKKQDDTTLIMPTA